jgi:hypothetical protein
MSGESCASTARAVPTATRWKPILSGGAAARANESVLEIATALREEPWAPERLHCGLAGGSAGIAIFYHELARRWPDSDFAAFRDRLWNAAIDAMADVPFARPNLYSGFTGVGWATALLTSEERSGNGDDDAHDDLEEGLLECLRTLRDPADYDLINGPAGWGAYALERWPHPRAVRALELIVDFFDQRAEHTPDGIRWHTAPELLPEWQRERAPRGYFNLGLSHGMPGVWVLLAQTLARDIRPEVSKTLLDGSVRWALAHRASGPTGLSFPTTVTDGAGVAGGGRLSWCYGDLGVAAALYLIGQVAARPEWTDEGLMLAHRLSTIRQETSRNVDAGLCHGTAGIAHIFNRFHQETGEEAFAHAAAYWIDIALGMRQEGIGPGRYAMWRHEPQPGWAPAPGLLEGSAGIGLALLAATGDRPANWDRFLAISPVPFRSPEEAELKSLDDPVRSRPIR